MFEFILFSLFLCLKIQLILMSDLKRVCYIRSEPEIPVNYIISERLCTHIIIGFSSVNNNVIEVNDLDLDFIRQLKAVITDSESDVILMLSIGGGGNDNGFHSAAFNDTNRQKFANSALEVVLSNGLDGIDLDWEFPAWGTVHYNDKHNFNSLLREIKQTFLDYSSANSSRAPLVLSAAVAAQYTILKRSYSVPQLIANVDFINLMSYDYYIYHWYWPFVGHNSPLFGRSYEWGILGTLNTEWSANKWHKLGADKSKIMVGIPTYGRILRLAFDWLTIPGTLVLGSSEDITYSEICKFLASNETTVVFDPKSMVPYAYRGYEWLTYESKESAAKKVDWIHRNGFGGVMTFSLNADDFRGQCKDNLLFSIQSTIRSVAFSAV